MPVGENYQFGYEHRLYIGANPLNGRPGDAGPPTSHYNTASQWTSPFDQIRDLNVGGGENTVDITTRDEGRRGFTVEPIVTQTGQISFQIRWQASQQADLSDLDSAFKKLLTSWRSKASVSLLELDQPATSVGAQGLVGNFNITFNWNKPVQGVVVVDVNARLVGFPDWVVAQDGTGNNFEVIENI
ncbi:MAG: hypothetical protein ACPGLY_27450 [Rubripirellula sp.]